MHMNPCLFSPQQTLLLGFLHILPYKEAAFVVILLKIHRPLFLDLIRLMLVQLKHASKSLEGLVKTQIPGHCR